jgi:hypothetical protein
MKTSIHVAWISGCIYVAAMVHDAKGAENPCEKVWQWQWKVAPTLTIEAPQDVPDGCVGQITVGPAVVTATAGVKWEVDVSDCQHPPRNETTVPITPVNTWEIYSAPPGTTPTSGSGTTAIFDVVNGGSVVVQFKSEASVANPPWEDAVGDLNYPFKVFAVQALEPSEGELIPDSSPPTYIVCPGSGDVVVTATPNPTATEAELPDCWTFTGGEAIAAGKLQRKVSKETPGETTFTCTAGASTKTIVIKIADCVCQTPLSNAEWAAVSDPENGFPNLIRCHTCKEDNATTTYNCLAWCIDDTSRWWWLEADTDGDEKISSEEMTAFLSSKGVAAGTIAYYGPNANDILHVAKKAGGAGADCKASSKLGPNIRISHDLQELEGGVYGDIVGGN